MSSTPETAPVSPESGAVPPPVGTPGSPSAAAPILPSEEPPTLDKETSAAAAASTSETTATAEAASSSAALPPPVPAPAPAPATADEARAHVAAFLRRFSCYDLLPPSGKVVVLDTRVALRLGFYALEEHGIKSAPLWSAEQNRLVGMVTSTDFIHVLIRFYKSGAISEGLSTHTLDSWLGWRAEKSATANTTVQVDDVVSTKESAAAAAAVAGAADADDKAGAATSGAGGDAADDGANGTKPYVATEAKSTTETAGDSRPPSPHRDGRRRLLTIGAEDSLYEACRLLRRHRIHHLPVVDPDEPEAMLHVMTHLGILHFLVTRLKADASKALFDHSVYDLGIGTFEDVLVAPEDTPLVSVIQLLVEKKISAVPLLDASGKVTHIYARHDVMFLTRTKQLSKQSLDTPIATVVAMQEDAIVMGASHQLSRKEKLHVAKRGMSVKTIVELFAKANVHRLVCVDDEGKCNGVVSLSDLFHFFLDKGDDKKA